VRLGILSDQTDWLDELNERDGFFQHFDCVFNSFHMGRESTIRPLRRRPEAPPPEWPAGTLYRRSEGHCLRARRAGMQVIHYEEGAPFSVSWPVTAPAGMSASR